MLQKMVLKITLKTILLAKTGSLVLESVIGFLLLNLKTVEIARRKAYDPFIISKPDMEPRGDQFLFRPIKIKDCRGDRRFQPRGQVLQGEKI